MGLLDLLGISPRPPGGVVLALGGGGVRGFAHLGVLGVLEEEKIPVAGIAGTSAGSLVGAMWLALGSVNAVESRWREFLAAGFLPSSLPDIRLSDEVSTRDNLLLHLARRLKTGAAVALAIRRRSLIEAEQLDRGIAFLLPDLLVEELPAPFAAVATDFATGEAVALRHGSLRLVVAASSAVPGVVPPYVVDGRTLIDGGVVADIPAREARALARRPVVAVDAGDRPGPDDPQRLMVPRALMRASVLTHMALGAYQVAGADLVLHPAVSGIHWSEFARFQEAVAAGRAAATAARQRLRAAAIRRSGRAPGHLASGVQA